MNTHHQQITLALQEAAADFVSSISNRQSLITVTRAELTPSNDRVTFYVSVFPESAEGPALGFLMRQRGTCRTYIQDRVPMRRIPHVEFVIDQGEKSRARVDELLSE